MAGEHVRAHRPPTFPPQVAAGDAASTVAYEVPLSSAGQPDRTPASVATWGQIDSTCFDAQGNTTWSLSAAGRALALADRILPRAEGNTWDTKKVRYRYDPVTGGDASGWTLRVPTRTLTQDGNGWATTITRYDTAGRLVESRTPGRDRDHRRLRQRHLFHQDDLLHRRRQRLGQWLPVQA